MPSTTHADERLLVLDDSVEIAELIGELGREAGFNTTVTTEADAFNAALERDPPKIIVLDLQMPKTDGIEILAQLSASGTTAGILIVTGMDKRTVVSAERFGRQAGLNMLGTLQKPFTPESMIAKLTAARDVTRQLTGADLNAAMDDSSLILYFQPVVRRLGPQSWHAESVEALPRWQHPVLGLLTPAQFLPLVGSERGGLMRRLTDFVLERGIAQLQSWQRDGLHLGLRVNVAAGLIADTGFPDRLERLLREKEADPALLTLEISDATSLYQSRDGIEILTRLRLKEINLSLDDFGAAGPAINGLYALPINEVKIDHCLTTDLAFEQGASVLFRGLVDIARQLGIVCCAEGVESAEQLNALDVIGCDLAQGFHIGVPVPAADIPKALINWLAEAPIHGTASAEQ